MQILTGCRKDMKNQVDPSTVLAQNSQNQVDPCTETAGVVIIDFARNLGAAITSVAGNARNAGAATVAVVRNAGNSFLLMYNLCVLVYAFYQSTWVSLHNATGNAQGGTTTNRVPKNAIVNATNSVRRITDEATGNAGPRTKKAAPTVSSVLHSISFKVARNS
ncbi:hypothetical protein ACH5RR_000720 [Cinchona calisaya]|uniref:Uncharacterized protein n=1 Tax=Cinchona calisaya TaxID=153742 RepID=A0ABD3B1K0_9GENT